MKRMPRFAMTTLLAFAAIPTVACPVDDNPLGGLEVSGTIDTSTTWTLADCPVTVTGDLYVEGPSSPVLTIEPGCTVRFTDGVGLYVSYYGEPGALNAVGTADQPIRFTSAGAQEPGAWAGIGIYAGSVDASTRLEYVTVEYGGGNFLSGDLVLSDARPVVKSSEFSHSQEHGISFDAAAAFGAGSDAITATGNALYGIDIGANSASTIPAGVYGGNTAGAVTIRGGTIAQTGTWRDLLLPIDYEVTGDVYVEGPASPVLTIAPGVSVVFAQGVGLYVSYYGEPGGLAIPGTSVSPVLLSGKVAQQGHWSGVGIYDGALDPQTVFSFTTIEHGGNWLQGGLHVQGAVPTLVSCTIQENGDNGIYLDDNARLAPASTANTVTGNALYGVSLVAKAAASVPEVGTYTGNTAGAVQIRGGTVDATGTWGDIGAPYVVTGDLYVEGPASPVLSIAANVTLRFGQNYGFYIGYYGEPGGLKLLGAAGQEVTLTAINPADAWAGLGFYPSAIDAQNAIEHTIIEYGGDYLDANLYFDGSALSSTVAVVSRNSDDYGVAWTCDAPTPNTGAMTFSNNTSGDTLPPSGC